MKALTCPTILEGCSTRSDGSLSLRFSTPELQPADKTAFFELLNKNLKMLLQPADEEPAQLHEVKGQFDRKTPGQRLRGVLFVKFKQSGEMGDWDQWYARRMEEFILAVKSTLAPDDGGHHRD